MRVISDGLERSVECQPGIDVTTEMGYDVKTRRFCPNEGADCAVRRLRLFGAIPLGSPEYVACADNQIPNVPPDAPQAPTVPIEDIDL